MYNYYRNANFHLLFFLRQRFWPFLFPSIAILFLIFCPQLSQSILINHNEQTENPDRTVAKLGPRDIQLTTTLAPLSIVPSTANFNNFIHTLYVISLDGKITAIDAGANGRQLWTADTGSPLVDSSLSKIEISRDSQSVRLIPSLIGGLYEKYDEDGHVEPLPFDADALLDASFKLHDDVVITGGKHIDTLGLDLHTGQILYSFSNDNSKQKNTTTTTNSDNNDSRDTLVVKRTTQTVRARSPRNGYEKWNFSVSNHDLFHLQTQPPTVIINQFNSNHQFEEKTKIFDHFEYQLQTGAVLAFDKSDNLLWSSAINAPIAAVWELKNGELHEKSLFETNKKSANENSEEEEQSSSPPISHRLAFVGEFNSTPYVLISPRVQKQLIYETRKNNQVAGPIGAKRPVLSSWHKAYQKRTLSIGSELPENNHPRAIGASTSDSHYPLALRPDPAGNHQTHTPTIVETCDTAGYLELITNPNDNFITENLEQNNLPLLVNQNTHSNIYIPSNTFTISSVFLGAIIVIWIWYRKQKQIEYSRQKSLTSEASDTVTITPPSTPEYHQLEQPLTPPFQSRYTLEYEHVCFLGRGGFGVVFEAINKLDERRVAIKRVSLKKASGKDRALKEIRYLAVLNHPNLIQYYYAWNESPPMAWQDEQDKLLLVRNNINTRDSMSTFPTSANDSESNNQIKPSVSNQKLSPSSHSPLFEITFDRSQNPLLINEDFSADDQKSQIISATSSSSSSFDNRLDANNNSKKSSSSSPLFDHSLDSSHEKHSLNREKSESDDDDGIVFLHDEKDSSSSSPPPPISTAEEKCLIEKKRLLDNDKDISPVYFYFVMELCQPESLRDRLTKRMIDRPQAWLIFDQIIKGIEYIHSKKLIHRDLKPSNILFSLDGTVKIGDFGLVSAFGEDKLAKKVKREDEKSDHFDITSSTTDPCGNDELGGTMLYMSPEQINRQPYNQKVDIYAMGIILFELLYPFSTQMERMQSIANVRLQTPVFPNDFERDGNNRNQLICRLIRWLLSHSPRDRPRASELRQDTFYQRMLQLEVPQLCCSDNRQQNQTIVSGQDQTPICHQRTRVPSSSSAFRRALSSSALQSHIESESGDGECMP